MTWLKNAFTSEKIRTLIQSMISRPENRGTESAYSTCNVVGVYELHKYYGKS